MVFAPTNEEFFKGLGHLQSQNNYTIRGIRRTVFQLDRSHLRIENLEMGILPPRIRIARRRHSAHAAITR